jgi:hypothetical protein
VNKADENWGWRYSSVVDIMFSICEVIPSATKKNKLIKPKKQIKTLTLMEQTFSWREQITTDKIIIC